MHMHIHLLVRNRFVLRTEKPKDYVLFVTPGENENGQVTGQTHPLYGMITQKARSLTFQLQTTGSFGFHSKITINSSTSQPFASLKTGTRRAQYVMNCRITSLVFAS